MALLPVDYSGPHGSVKAILRDSKGFTQERVVQYPPPPYIYMAKAISHIAVNSLEASETIREDAAQFDQVRFRYVSMTSMADPWKDDRLYTANYEEDPYVKYDDIAMATVEKLRPAIQNSISQAGTFHDAMLKQQAAAATNKEKLALQAIHEAEQEKLAAAVIYKIAAEHQKKHGYGKATEERMVHAGGKKNPPAAYETPQQYLDRLLAIVQAEDQKADMYKYDYGYQQQWIGDNTSQQYPPQTTWQMQTSLIPQNPILIPATPQGWDLQNSGGLFGNQAFGNQFLPQAPEPEKPKKPLPKHEEPKKRFLKTE